MEDDWSENLINFLKDSLLPLTLALQSLLAILELLDAFNVTYFPTIHRATITRTFNLGFSLAPALLLLSSITIVYLLRDRRRRDVLVLSSASLGLYLVAGLRVSAAFLSVMLVAATLLRFKGFQDYAFWILVLATGFEGLAFLHWILMPFGIYSPMAWLADLELSLFYIVAPIAPLLAIAVLCMWFLRPMIEYVGIDKYLESRLNLSLEPRGEEINIHPRILLALALTFSVVGALYPYSPNINPRSFPVGVDVRRYVDWMAEVEKSPYSAFTIVGGSRPTILLLIYALKYIFGSSVGEVVKYLPTLLNPLMAFSVYIMVSEASGEHEWASLSSLFTALGFTTTVGMYSYFLSNILGLILIFLSIGLFFKSLRMESNLYLVLSTGLGSFASFTHPWTFTQYHVTIILFLCVLYYRKLFGGYFRIFTYIFVTGLVDFLHCNKGYIWIVSTINPFLEVTKFWTYKIFAFRLLYGGLLSNSFFLFLAALGTYILNLKKRYYILLTSLLTTSSIYCFLYRAYDIEAMHYAMEISRVLFNIPFSVFAALTILFLIRNDVFKRRIREVLVIFIQIYMGVYLLRSLANLI